MFSFLAKPFLTLIQSLLTKRVIKFCDRIDSYRSRYGGNSNSQSNQPSAPPPPPPPYYNEEFTENKYD